MKTRRHSHMRSVWNSRLAVLAVLGLTVSMIGALLGEKPTIECGGIAAGSVTTDQGGLILIGQPVTGVTTGQGLRAGFGRLYCLQRLTLGPFPCLDSCADHDGDGTVTVRDFAHLQNCFGVTTDTIPCECADLDGDNRIYFEDFEILHGLLGGQSSNTPPACP